VQEEKKPVKARKLKVIDHLGTLYATFDGSSIWKIDRAAFNVLRECDGKKTVDEIVKLLARRIGYSPEDVKPVVEKILNELTEMKFIEWI
jgi:hypothetical protein